MEERSGPIFRDLNAPNALNAPMKITRFEHLECWQEAGKLVNLVYAATRDGAFRKDLRLSGQIQAAAGSSMANIAVGFVRRSDKEFVQFLFIAMASTGCIPCLYSRISAA